MQIYAQDTLIVENKIITFFISRQLYTLYRIKKKIHVRFGGNIKCMLAVQTGKIPKEIPCQGRRRKNGKLALLFLILKSFYILSIDKWAKDPSRRLKDPYN